MKLFFYLLLFVPFSGSYAKAPVESILGKVGGNAVHYSDLMRFKSVVQVMNCAGIRAKVAGNTEKLQQLFDRYVNEELIFLEAKKKFKKGSGQFEQTIAQIRSFPKCINRWRGLGETFRKHWSKSNAPLAGESMLVKELEKRLLVDLYIRNQIGTDLNSWLLETRAKIPVQVYVR